jgi:hypothetical protein
VPVFSTESFVDIRPDQSATRGRPVLEEVKLVLPIAEAVRPKETLISLSARETFPFSRGAGASSADSTVTRKRSGSLNRMRSGARAAREGRVAAPAFRQRLHGRPARASPTRAPISESRIEIVVDVGMAALDAETPAVPKRPPANAQRLSTPSAD